MVRTFQQNATELIAEYIIHIEQALFRTQISVVSVKRYLSDGSPCNSICGLLADSGDTEAQTGIFSQAIWIRNFAEGPSHMH